MNAKKIEPSLELVHKDEQVIDSVRIYQGVVFEKKTSTYFLSRDIKGRKGVEIELGSFGVELKSALDNILIPWANVSCVYFRSKIKEDLIKQGEDAVGKNVGVKSSEIKRPR